jgi:hypothetical protein
MFVWASGTLQMFERVDIEGMLNEYISFLMKTKLDPEMKIKYLKLMANFLQDSLESQTR